MTDQCRADQLAADRARITKETEAGMVAYGNAAVIPGLSTADRVTQLDHALAKCLEEHRLTLVVIDRLQKECAAGCLQLLDRAFIGTVEEGLADLIRGKTDMQVVALVAGHYQFPLDTCTRCGRPAPVKDEPPVCAWGCPG